MTKTALEQRDDEGWSRLGRNLEAMTANLGVVTVRGDATSINSDGVVTALVDGSNTTADGFWFFEVASSFASAIRFRTATCMILSLAHVSSGDLDAEAMGAKTAAAPKPASIVLMSPLMNLYLMTQEAPKMSDPDWLRWTEHAIPFDTSAAWRKAGPIEQFGSIDRLPIRSTDPAATMSEIRDVLASLESIRIRGGQPAQTEMVLLRTLVIIRPVEVEAEA